MQALESLYISQTSNIKAVDMSFNAELKQKSTKNSYLILLLSKDRLKHHGKSEKLSVYLCLAVSASHKGNFNT